MVNYNFFISLVICKTLVGLYSSPGLPLKEGWINGEKDNIILRLAGGEKKNFTLRGEKKIREDFGGPPKKQKGKKLTLLDGERDCLRGTVYRRGEVVEKCFEWKK